MQKGKEDEAEVLRGKELYCTVSIGTQDPKGVIYEGQMGVRTRALHVAADAHNVAINETFLLELPERMAGALFSDHPRHVDIILMSCTLPSYSNLFNDQPAFINNPVLL